MVNQMEKIILEFSDQIKEKFADYVALYSFFIKYMKDTYSDYEYSLEEFLNHDFSRRDIIASCVQYVEKSPKVKGVAAIDKYLNAMTKLYEGCFVENGFDNRNLFSILPFGSLKAEVREQLKDTDLKEKESIGPISSENVDEILNYLDSKRTKSDISFRKNSILIKLLLLYGFKLERLKYMLVEDVELEKHILNVRSSIYGDIFVKLELPYGVVNELKEYIDLLKQDKDFTPKQYLFFKKNKKIIDSAMINTTIDAIKKETNNSLCRITITGIAKFAIINMIKEGINKANIKLITGMQDIVVDDCEKRFLEQQFTEGNDAIILNREINKKIRGIEIYDRM